jgi:hypothetical protein
VLERINLRGKHVVVHADPMRHDHQWRVSRAGQPIVEVATSVGKDIFLRVVER